MSIPLTFLWVVLAFFAMAIWEADIEGRHPWASAEVGWRKRLSRRVTLTKYHFWLYIMFAILLSLPLVVHGWDARLAGVIVSAAATGAVVEDFCWFLANPFYGIRKFNARDADWYPWLRIGPFEIPWLYLIFIFVAIASWALLWR